MRADSSQARRRVRERGFTRQQTLDYQQHHLDDHDHPRDVNADHGEDNVKLLVQKYANIMR